MDKNTTWKHARTGQLTSQQPIYSSYGYKHAQRRSTLSHASYRIGFAKISNHERTDAMLLSKISGALAGNNASALKILRLLQVHVADSERFLQLCIFLDECHLYGKAIIALWIFANCDIKKLIEILALFDQGGFSEKTVWGILKPSLLKVDRL